MSVINKQFSSSVGSIVAEIRKMVEESLKLSSKTFLRGVNVARTIATQKSTKNVKAMDMAKRWTKFNLKMSQIISRHNQEAVNEIIDAMEHYGLYGADETPMPSAPPKKSAGPGMIISLSSKRNAKTAGSFIVANPGNSEMVATFSAGDFINEEDHIVKNVDAVFSPASLKLAPNQEASVEVSLNVASKFRVDKVYLSKVLIAEHPDKEIILKLHVLSAKRAKKSK